jgi:predicted dehydrogenase
MAERINVAVVGLGFGEAFIPIYLEHPGVGTVTIVDPDTARLREVGERYSLSSRHEDLGSVLIDESIDAVHILSPVPFHAEQSIAVLEAEKHCACAVPMALTIEDLEAVLAAQRASRKNYMMMETAVFGREYLTVRDLYRDGALGTPTFYRGFHIQNLDGFPRYWQGYPPMAYVTHALSPILALLETVVTQVQCLGSGRLTDDRLGDYDNPFPVEVAMFQLDRSDLVADVTMSFFQTARSYTEGFSIYGDAMGVEWPVEEGGPLSRFTLAPPEPGRRGRHVATDTLEPRDYPDLLPPEIASFTSGGHGGSHPHLVHEFVSSILESRPPAIDARTAAQWTAPGIVAHASALAGGQQLAVPDFGA